MKISPGPARIAATLLFALLLPILAACGGTPQASEPTPALPTAAVNTPGQAQPTAASAPTTGDAATAEPAPTTGDAATAEPVPVPDGAGVTGPLKTPYLEFGVIDHLYYTDRGRVLILTNNAGFDWVRQQIHWKDIEGPEPGNYAWGDLDVIVDDAATHNVKLLLSIVKSPNFYNETNGLPRDPKPLGDFVDALMQRYGNKIGALEIWNEQNLARENGGRVTLEDAGHYVEVLAEAYRRIKAISPETFVLAAPPSSTGFSREDVAVPDEDFYRAMYSYKDGMIKNYFDAQAVHPGGAANPPQTLFPDNPHTVPNCPPELGSCWTNDATHYFRHVENVRRFMEEEGVGDHQIWVTEFGWATKNNTPGYEFGNFVTQEQQAQYTVDALRLAHENYRYPDGSSWMGVMFLWNMNFAVIWGGQGNPEHEEASFGLLNPDWSPRPVFTAVQGFIAEVKQER